MPVSETRTPSPAGSPDETALPGLRRRALLVSGMGFFTDAYDLFVIGIVSTLLKAQWHLGTDQLALLNAVMLGAAFLGALVFGRAADIIGRTRVYWMSAALMVIAAIGSALAPSLAVLIAFRFLLGFGVGGDYPVSAVLMSEYADGRNRGRMVGLVFSTQAVGLIVGPVIALALLGGGVGPALTWRILLGLGAIPAAAAVWLRRKMPEPPRYQAQSGSLPQTGTLVPARATVGLRSFLASGRLLVLLAGTAGCWFLLDYAYYGNTISTPQIIALITPHASQTTTIAIQLAIFAVAAVPGYALAVWRMDRIGHRRLQLVGFIMMGACFAVIGLVPGMTTAVVPFLLAYGISYFFTEFGPNVTTFVLPGELFPTRFRATGHGISAGVGKLGAFIGVFLFPVFQHSLGLRGTLLLTAGISVIGALLTLVLPEPAGRSLEEISGETEAIAAAEDAIRDVAEPAAVTLLASRQPRTQDSREVCQRRDDARSPAAASPQQVRRYRSWRLGEAFGFQPGVKQRVQVSGELAVCRAYSDPGALGIVVFRGDPPPLVLVTQSWRPAARPPLAAGKARMHDRGDEPAARPQQRCHGGQGTR
jgi:PHS family inorganic phosphate transporter-like MFS transporter